jgi:toxin ParE1/3/4
MSRPYFSPSSRQDLLDILEYISRDKPGAATAFVEKLENECWMLANNPGLGSVRDDLMPELRCWSVGKYVIYFFTAADGIDVARVLHGARDVGRWIQ